MLVLSRKKGESILIGDDIEITVVAIRGDVGKVRIGIEAPRELSIHRHEVWERIKEQEEALGESDG